MALFHSFESFPFYQICFHNSYIVCYKHFPPSFINSDSILSGSGDFQFLSCFIAFIALSKVISLNSGSNLWSFHFSNSVSSVSQLSSFLKYSHHLDTFIWDSKNILSFVSFKNWLELFVFFVSRKKLSQIPWQVILFHGSIHWFPFFSLYDFAQFLRLTLNILSAVVSDF